MATGSVDMWCAANSSVGLEVRGAVPTSTPGMNGKAWEVGEEKRAPQSAVSLQEIGNLAIEKLTFLFCVFLNRTRNWTSSTRRTQSPCFAPV